MLCWCVNCQLMCSAIVTRDVNIESFEKSRALKTLKDFLQTRRRLGGPKAWRWPVYFRRKHSDSINWNLRFLRKSEREKRKLRLSDPHGRCGRNRVTHRFHPATTGAREFQIRKDRKEKQHTATQTFLERRPHKCNSSFTSDSKKMSAASLEQKKPTSVTCPLYPPHIAIKCEYHPLDGVPNDESISIAC